MKKKIHRKGLFKERVTIRCGVKDLWKLEFCTKNTGLSNSEFLRVMIDIMYHDLNPPFREYSS